MNEKQKQIMDVATKLFGEKGVHATSIQQIADKSGISKGAFYLHFRSKDELILSIVKYFYEMVYQSMKQMEQLDISPREQFTKQLYVQFEHIIHHKPVYMMLIKEQSIPINQEIDDYIQKIRTTMENWYVHIILSIYGEQAKKYLIDLTILFEGIRSFYEKLLLIDDVSVDLVELPHYIVRRYDDLVSGLIEKNEQPLIAVKKFGSFFEEKNEQTIYEHIRNHLLHIEQMITQTNLSNESKETLHETIDYLLSELTREQIRPFIFKGMLANFKIIPETQPDCEAIATLLHISLI